jgi:phosphotriesterase-related protein
MRREGKEEAMSSRSYWQGLAEHRLSRRCLLRAGAAAGLGAASLALSSCAGGEEEGALATIAATSEQPRPTPPPGAYVETATGPVSTSDMGFTLMHEHIFVLSEGVAANFPSVWDEEAKKKEAVEVLRRLKDRGVSTLLDPTVLGSGRNVPLVQQVARESGLQVIVATGLYTYDELPYYFQTRSVDHMAELFVQDITEGVQGTSVRAGVLKCATDHPGVTPGVEKVLRAVAKAHRRTGVPITTHTEAKSQRGLAQQDVFESEGVDLSRVIIGHSGDTEDIEYLTKLLERGSYIGMDRFGLDVYLPTEKRVAVVARLCEMGYAERMVLSQDAAVYMDWFTPEVQKALGPKWSHFHILDDVLPALRQAGVSEEQIRTMTVENPRRIFEDVGGY